VYDASGSDVFDTILQIVDKLELYKEKVNKQNGQIIVSTGVSLWSWGERIIIQITEEGPKTRVTVSSTPKAQLFDWGKSQKNEKAIVKKLSTLLGER